MRQVVKSRVNKAPGRVVEVPLGEGRCGYGWVGAGGSQVAFFDVEGAAGEPVDLLELVKQPVVFAVSVMDYAFKRNGTWTLLDIVTLTQEEENVTIRKGKRDPINGRYSIYWEHPASHTWGEHPAEREDVIGLEAAAVYDPEHVEKRLRNHLAGIPYKEWAYDDSALASSPNSARIRAD